MTAPTPCTNGPMCGWCKPTGPPIDTARIRELEAGIHVVEFTHDRGYALQHPPACRPDLLGCPVNLACRHLDECPVDAPGRFHIDLDEHGDLVILGPAALE